MFSRTTTYCYLTFCLLVLLCQPANARQKAGQGSFIYKAGNIQLMTQANIQLLRENLHIKVQGDYCIVEAQFDLKNNGEARVVNYGFPIDFIEGRGENKGWQDDYVLYFMMEEGKNRLPVRQQIRESVYQVTLLSQAEVSVATKLYLTDIFFEANQLKHLHVRYKIKSSFTEKDSSRNILSSYSERRFTYDLASGQHEGGIARHFSLSIDTQELSQHESKIKITGFNWLSGHEGHYTYKASNMDIKNARVLEIIYDDTPLKLSGFISKSRIKKDKIKHIASSSQVREQLLIADLSDADFSTAWISRSVKPPVKEWLEIEMTPNARINALAIVNGCADSRENYYANGRAKLLKVELTFTKESEAEGMSMETEVREIQLPKIAYTPIDEYNFGDMVSVLFNYEGLGRKIKKIRIYVEEVYPGNKNSNVCISELFILGN